METAWLEDLLKLTAEGNFSRAAEARNLSQPAFSRRIKALEDWTGATLVDRDTHRIALTPAGDALVIAAQDVLRRLEQGRTTAREVDAGHAGTVRFASTHALSMTFFPDWLRSFDGQHGENTISLVADNMVGCERLMLDGRADFLLCHHHPAASHRLDASAFVSIDLGTDLLAPLSAVGADGCPLYVLPGTPADPLPLLAFDEQSGMGRILAASNRIKDGGAALKPVFQSHLASMLLTWARDRRGLAWLPLTLAQDDLDNGRLVRVGGVAWDVPIQIRLFRLRARRSPAVEAFWNLASQNTAQKDADQP